MSKHSRAKRSGSTAEQLTFFAAGFPVNPQASPESEKEPPMIAGSGLTFCAWCLKSIPCGCWRRILAECLVSTLAECGSANGLRTSLQLEVTSSCPSSWLLKTLARRTGEKEFSSSGEAWMTPDASDWKQDGLEASKRRLEKCSTISLNAQARLTWPTPAAMNPNDGEDLATWLARRERLKETAKNGNGCGTPLSIAVQLESASAWPTPTATDAKASGAAGYSTASGRHSGTTLTDATVGPRGPESRSTSGKSRARLNHRWVAQLLGFPSDWLDGIAEQA